VAGKKTIRMKKVEGEGEDDLYEMEGPVPVQAGEWEMVETPPYDPSGAAQGTYPLSRDSTDPVTSTYILPDPYITSGMVGHELARHEAWRKGGGTTLSNRRTGASLLFGPMGPSGSSHSRVRSKSFYEWAKREAPNVVESYTGKKRRAKSRRKSQKAGKVSPMARMLMGR